MRKSRTRWPQLSRARVDNLIPILIICPTQSSFVFGLISCGRDRQRSLWIISHFVITYRTHFKLLVLRSSLTFQISEITSSASLPETADSVPIMPNWCFDRVTVFAQRLQLFTKNLQFWRPNLSELAHVQPLQKLAVGANVAEPILFCGHFQFAQHAKRFIIHKLSHLFLAHFIYNWPELAIYFGFAPLFVMHCKVTIACCVLLVRFIKANHDDFEFLERLHK